MDVILRNIFVFKLLYSMRNLEQFARLAWSFILIRLRINEKMELRENACPFRSRGPTDLYL